MKAVFHTEDINSYGFWILLSGIVIERYKKNPVLLYNHEGYTMSVGKVNNLRVEDNKLVGEVEFDEGDEIGKELKRKYEKGYMSGFSIGIKTIEWSEESTLLKQGQTRPTVTKSELYEISAVNLPSNSNALKMHFAEGISLSGDIDEAYLSNIIPKIQTQSKMKKIAITLGLSADATEEQIISAITNLKTEASKSTELATANIELVLAYGKNKGVINEKNEATYKKAAEKDVQLARELIDNSKTIEEEKPKEEKLSDLLEDDKSSGPKIQEKTWTEMSEEDLQTLRTKSPEKYSSIFEKEYGFKPF